MILSNSSHKGLVFRQLCFVFLLQLAFFSAVFGQVKTHTIKSGETLSSIAKKYKTTIEALQKLNPDTKDGIKAGAELQIPTLPSQKGEEKVEQKNAQKERVIQKGTAKRHEVKAGESLFKIAKKYKVSVKELENWNGIKNSDLKSGQEIYVSAPDNNEGKVLSVPAKEIEEKAMQPEEDGAKHIVGKGQTLSVIARKYGVSISDIRKANQLKSDKLDLGQVLMIPTGEKPTIVKPDDPKQAKQPEPVKNEMPEDRPKALPEQVKAPVQEVPKPEAIVENVALPKEEPKLANGIREINNTLGYTRVVETGFAEAIEGDGNSKKHLCLHKSAPVGAILQVKNETNGQSVFVKVIGKLPETGSNEKIIIRISRQAYDRLLAVGKRFPVEVSYPQAQP